MKMTNKIKIGIIGGTGLDDINILSERQEKEVTTPFGKPSDCLVIGKIENVDCVLLARHDRAHSVAPTNINYRANIWALKEEGCTHVLVSTACGSLREEIRPGHFVFLDQGIDRTNQRTQTFYCGKVDSHVGICHLPMAEPFNKKIRGILQKSAADLDIPHHNKGTMVTIEGPRFSTKAESLMFRMWGADTINMTTFPEVVLANEAGLLYASVALATDYDCWHESEEPVSVEMVLKTMKENAENCKKLFLNVVPRLAKEDWADDIKAAQDRVNGSIMMPRKI